ncbi:Lsr2 family protein [Terrabacter carboxydivorans]|uniref:Lsr2 family protein n=1 Tax=Terrabacter carboxydivorans TaxID=619730 RepID=A0ABP5ZNY4_9MICO
MATQTFITLIDDTDGTEAAETLTFALDGVQYEIDLNDKNAKALRDTIGTWAGRARSGGKPTQSRRTIKAVGHSRSALIRAWAAKQGVQVPARGRIPGEVQQQYDAAH